VNGDVRSDRLPEAADPLLGPDGAPERLAPQTLRRPDNGAARNCGGRSGERRGRLRPERPGGRRPGKPRRDRLTAERDETHQLLTGLCVDGALGERLLYEPSGVVQMHGVVAERCGRRRRRRVNGAIGRGRPVDQRDDDPGADRTKQREPGGDARGNHTTH
jgi:hypothetical protein